MMAAPSKPPAGGEKGVALDVEGKPKNQRFRANMFEEEVVLTEKQKLRQEMLDNSKRLKEKIKLMTPYDMFVLFDEDDSGLISFEEFRKMLPFLDVKISDAKAFRYFRICDTDGSGEIDIDEFQVALFICDPTNGNPVGFRPSSQLTPMDAFELFDEGQTGFLEEDEYRYGMDYLKITASDEVLENLFKEFDHNAKGMIDYVEFREIFLRVCDVRRELEDRGVDVPSMIRKNTLRKMFKEILLEEEDRERRALTEARRYKQWMLNIRASKKILQKADFRSYLELRNALDAAGHVYVIGSGAYGQFNQPAAAGKSQINYEKILELWKDRVQPQQLIDRLRLQRKQEEQDEKRDAERPSATGMGALAALDQKIIIDPWMEAQESPFLHVNVSLNTASLWGRRIHQVAIAENTLFALADTGEVFSWGGNSYWWHEIQADSIYQKVWRGDTTARSQLLLGTTGKTLPIDSSIENTAELLTGDDLKVELVKLVAKYYNVWEPPPIPAQRMVFIEKDILTRIEYDMLVFALQCRGKVIKEMTKMQLVEMLYEDIILEKRLLGERAHKAIKEIEMQIFGLQKRKKMKLANKFLKKIEDMWAPLREVQAEKNANKVEQKVTSQYEQIINQESTYATWRSRVQGKRESMDVQHTPRGNSVAITVQGATPRGAGMNTPRGYEASLQISAGASHVCLIHKTGQLYTWGVGVSGRLGHDMTTGNPQGDASVPTIVQALRDRPVIRVSAGYGHTGAIVSGGEVYMWGSTATGKCGLGPITASEECFCSIPTRVIVGPEDRRVRKISCGAGHTGVITEGGQVYMFGCGDGGRLGLGHGRFATQYVPVLAECLLSERILSISCGNTTTIVSTEIHKQWVGDIDDKHRMLAGGKVFITGSANVLGQQFDVFTHLPIVSIQNDVVIKHVSAGFMHSVLISAEGELFAWGHNRNGCCGQPLANTFIPHPLPVPFLYTRPANLALNKSATQSSTYNRREAKYAVNGDIDGFGVLKCSSTHQQAQPYIEIDLGKIAVIDKIVIYNRTDTPSDRNMPADLFTARLFPCWVMVGREAFPKSANIISLKDSLRQAVCKAKLTEDKRVSTWRCPANAQGRFVRLQLERYNTLSIAEIEIYGYWGYSRGVGRCSHALAGREVTVAVVRGSTDPSDIETAYKKAVYADSGNADILRQFETYSLEYDKYGRGEVLGCDICNSSSTSTLCESCLLYDTYKKDILNMPPVIGGRRRRLQSISDFLINSNKPELQQMTIPKMDRPERWKMTDMLKLKLKSIFSKSAEPPYITPEQALARDPAEMMSTLTYMQKAAQEKEVTAVEEISAAEYEEEEENSAILPEEESIEMQGDGEIDGSVGQSSSIGTLNHALYKHGHAPKKKMEVGEMLPGGQIIKPAFPKSIAQQLDEHRDRVDKRERRDNASLPSVQSSKGGKRSMGSVGNSTLSRPSSVSSLPAVGAGGGGGTKGILKKK